MPDTLLHLYLPLHQRPKAACLACEVSWIATEADACFLCGEPGLTYREYERHRLHLRARGFM